MKRVCYALCSALLIFAFPVHATELQAAVKRDYDAHLPGQDMKSVVYILEKS